MGDITISIIVPIYNAGEHLRTCLDSLVNQTLKNIEIITVLDCPTDGSDKVVEEFAAMDSRIKVIRNKENLHIGNSRNEGLKIARGKYVGFSDHDDYCDPRMYEILLEKASHENLDIVCSPYIRQRHSNNQKDVYRLDDFPDVSPEEQTRILLETTIGLGTEKDPQVYMHSTIWNKLFRTDIIKKNDIKFVDTRRSNAEDICFIMEFSSYCKRSGFVNTPLYYHNIGIGNTGNTYFYNQYDHTLCYLEYMYSFLSQKDLLRIYEGRFYNSVALRSLICLFSEFKISKSFSLLRKRMKTYSGNPLIVAAFKKNRTLYFMNPNKYKNALYKIVRYLIFN